MNEIPARGIRARTAGRADSGRSAAFLGGVYPEPDTAPPLHWQRRVFPLSTLPPLTRTRRVVAIHEAAHLVVARAVGLPIHGARLFDCADGETAGCASLHPSQPMTNAPNAQRNSQGVGDFYEALHHVGGVMPAVSTDDRALRVATMLSAGLQAELLAAGHPWPGLVLREDPDCREARHLVPSCALAWCQMTARWHLCRRWSEVDLIARELDLRGEWFAQPMDDSA